MENSTTKTTKTKEVHGIPIAMHENLEIAFTGSTFSEDDKEKIRLFSYYLTELEGRIWNRLCYQEYKVKEAMEAIISWRNEQRIKNYYQEVTEDFMSQVKDPEFLLDCENKMKQIHVLDGEHRYIDGVGNKQILYANIQACLYRDCFILTDKQGAKVAKKMLIKELAEYYSLPDLTPKKLHRNDNYTKAWCTIMNRLQKNPYRHLNAKDYDYLNKSEE